MKKTVGILVLLLCLVTCWALTACATVTYSVQIGVNGARTLTLRVQYGDDTTDEDKAYIKTFLEEVSATYRAAGRDCTVKEGEGYITLKEEFESATDYMIAMGYTGDEPNDDPTPSVNLNAYFLEYVSEMSLASKATVLSYAFRYAIGDYTAKGKGNLLARWRAYCSGYAGMVTHPLCEVYAELARTDMDGLYQATAQALESEKGEALADDLAVWLADKGYNLRDVNFRYTYEHIYKSVYPKECTKSYKNSETGATVYEWDMTVADIPATTVVLCQKAPRAWAWELTAIGAGLVALVVTLTIILVKRRKMNDASRETEQ